MSPTTPNPSRSPPQNRKNPARLPQEQQNGSPAQQWFPIQKPTKGEWGVRREDSSNKSKWPTLNVVTNFSKPPTLTAGPNEGRDSNPDAKKGQHQDRSIGNRNPFVAKPGWGRMPSGKALKTSGSKGRLDDLKRASSKVSNLSPSDRAVVIGISIPPGEMPEQIISPDVDRSLGPRQYAHDRSPSIAPSILITPAKEHDPWSDFDGDYSSPPQGRPASSVYSQMPTPNTRKIDSSIVPPVPPLPPEAKAQNSSNAQLNRAGKPSRVLSDCTVFDEDDTPTRGAPGSPASGESQLRILKRPASTDTLATRHRSQGWWNYIVSPFFPKSPMNFGRNHPGQDDIPALPTSKGAFGPGHEEGPPRHERKHEDVQSAHTSWTDSSIDADHEKRDLDTATIPTANKPFAKGVNEASSKRLSSLPAPFQGLGAAAEYFEACLYDMHSSEPFFECQNHTCRPSTFGPMDASKGMQNPRQQNTRNLMLEPHDTSSHQGPKSNGAVQVPTNRFSAAFHEAIGTKPKARPESEATVIEDLDATPDVHEAHAAPVVKAPEPISATQPTVDGNDHDASREAKETPNPVSAAPTHTLSKQERPSKRFVAVMPPEPGPRHFEEPLSPEPPTPGAHREAPRGAFALAEMPREEHFVRKPVPITKSNDHNDEEDGERTTVADLYPPLRDNRWLDNTWEVRDKEELLPREHKARFIKFGTCFKRDKPVRKSKTPMDKKRKRIIIAITAGLLAMMILILVLVMTLTRNGDQMLAQSQWLNITGYPPIPTGISTIAQPHATKEDSACIQPSTMWSCALPKEQQPNIAPNAPDQPNFRVEIRFQNGTNATTTNGSSISKRFLGPANPVSAGSFIRNKMLHIRDSFSNALLNPSPSPPSQEDQIFLGNTTDGNHAPVSGEYTPFFMSFESPNSLPSRLLKRSSKRDANSSFPDLNNAIPPPSTNPDGTATPGTLYPFPSAQPLRLFDRGLSTEHYGFYTYFDHSIFLKSLAPLNATTTNIAPIPDDSNGGSPENAASVRCTWSQTRFLVQIWTNKGNPVPLLQSNTSNTSASPNGNVSNITNSSANDFSRPGSFPYPITLTLDRHGGDINKKMIYCYGLDDQEKAVASEKKLQIEDRSVGGQLVNPALGPFGNVNVTFAEGGPGGVDGGSGGCGCVWENWR